MPIQVDPEIATIPGSAGGDVQMFGNAWPRVFVFDGDLLTYDLWPSGGALRGDIVLTLTYDATLSRVRAVGTALTGFITVSFERSTDLVSWTTIRGGASVTVAGDTARVDDYEFAPNVVNYYRMRTRAPFTETVIATITPVLTAVWLKSVARPFLNLTVSLLGQTFSYERPERTGTFAVVGRSLPIAVTDVRGSRQYPIFVRTDTDGASTNLDLLLASGDVLFLHAPPGMVVPAGGVHVAAGRVASEYPMPPDQMRFTRIDLTEVAAPGPDVVGATSTWQTVLNTYATWADVMAANATWANLLELVGSPSEVVVP